MKDFFKQKTTITALITLALAFAAFVPALLPPPHGETFLTDNTKQLEMVGAFLILWLGFIVVVVMHQYDLTEKMQGLLTGARTTQNDLKTEIKELFTALKAPSARPTNAL